MNNLCTIVETTLVPHTAFNNVINRMEQCYRYAENAVELICLPIVGESRTGKSRALETFMMSHPSTRDEDGMRIPVLSVTAPWKPTVGGLLDELLVGMGDEKFYIGTESIRTKRLQHLLKECGTIMIIIDEFQHFIDKGTSQIAYIVADWLKILIGKSKVSLVTLGLPSSLKVLSFNEQIQGRFMSPIVMPRFDWYNAEHASEFVGILEAFHTEMSKHFFMPELHAEEMAFRFYCATGGLIGYLTKMLREVVWQACDENCKRITLEDLSNAFNKAVRVENVSNPMPDPFQRSFMPMPTQELLKLAASIGTHVEPAISGRVAKRKQKAA